MFLKVVKVLLKCFDILIGNLSPAYCYLMLLAQLMFFLNMNI